MTVVKKKTSSNGVIQCTQQDIDNIIAAFKKTIVLGTVAGLVKRHRETIDRWLKWGAEDLLCEKDTPLSQLYVAVKEQVSLKIIELEQQLLANPEGWQRFAWMLERTVKRDYSVYGDMWKDFEQKLNELILRQAEREQPQVRVVSKDMRDWIKSKLAEGKPKFNPQLEYTNAEKMDSEGDQEKRLIESALENKERQEDSGGET